MKSRVHGKTHGVGADIIKFLDTVAHHFHITIVVTSGYRDSAAQARAMFDNWLHLGRGTVYKKSTLPELQRKALDKHYVDAHDAKKLAAARAAEKGSFLKLAMTTVGTKSAHCKGRAVDVATATLPAAAHGVIIKRMTEIQEGNRHDIYHFESRNPVPAVTEAELRTWITPDLRPQPAHSHHHVLVAKHAHAHAQHTGPAELPCIC